jgi:hypothetical protein
LHEGRLRENCPNHFPLDSDATAMDDPQGFVPQAMRLDEMFLHYLLHVFGERYANPTHP